MLRVLAHDPEVLGKVHALAAEAGIPPGAAKALAQLSAIEPTAMRDLAASLRCDNSYVTTIVDNLEEAGVARREAHPTDRRIKVIVLTDGGRQLADRVAQMLRTPPAAFDVLTAAETTQLFDQRRQLST
jgi:DNA-binding MarR family transcriptional regulator